MKKISIFLLFISTSVFGMHHGKLDVIVFAIDLEINSGKESSAVSFVSKITENVKKNEPQTLVYQYHFSDEENKVFLLEIYPNNEAAIFHMKNFTGTKWEAGFVENFAIKSASILGNASSKLKDALSPYTEDFRGNLYGFDRVAGELGEEISNIK